MALGVCWEFKLSLFFLAASLKSLGEKTASLFDRKKKDAETLAAEKASTAQKMAEEQVRKAGEAVGQTRSEAENLAASTGSINWIVVYKLDARVASID